MGKAADKLAVKWAGVLLYRHRRIAYMQGKKPIELEEALREELRLMVAAEMRELKASLRKENAHTL